jgi:hypothetical protein
VKARAAGTLERLPDFIQTSGRQPTPQANAPLPHPRERGIQQQHDRSAGSAGTAAV